MQRQGKKGAAAPLGAGAAGRDFQTAVRLRLGSKWEEYAAGRAVTSHHVTAP